MSVSTMKKLILLSHRADADALVRRLMRLRCVQLRPAKETEGLLPTDLTEVEARRTLAERRLADIEQVIPLLAVYGTRRKRGRQAVDRRLFLRDERDQAAMRAVTKALELHERNGILTAEETRLRNECRALLPWLEYDAPLGDTGSKRTSVFYGILPPKTDAEAFAERVDAAGGFAETVLQDGTGLYVAVTAVNEERNGIERALVADGFLTVTFPKTAGLPRSLYEENEDRLEALAKEREAMTEQMRDLAEYLTDIETLHDMEATEAELCRQKRKLLSTQSCVLIEGWIPSDAEEILTEALSKFECACELSDPEEDEEVPVKLRNNWFSSTFEWVIGMYSYPKYGTYDPTVPMSIFYFLIFGLMFADVGYGLLMMMACFLGIRILQPKPGMKQMLLMFGYCGISCMVMGVLFGGWFGNLPTAIMNSFVYHAEGIAETTPWGRFFSNGIILNPINSPTAFLMISLAMGEIHLVAGMAVNMIETFKKGQRAEALCSTLPIWVLFLGIDLLAPALAVDLVVSDPASVTEATRALLATLSDIGMVVLFAGMALILLLKGVGKKGFFGWLMGGLGGLYSLIGLASDILSYSRILALGLVAGVIAQVINMLTNMGAGGGPLGFAFMVIVMLAGHALNLAINLLGTFVHAARLQYIEFFGKFYEDGGEPFQPLSPVEEYTVEAEDVYDKL